MNYKMTMDGYTITRVDITAKTDHEKAMILVGLAAQYDRPVSYFQLRKVKKK